MVRNQGIEGAFTGFGLAAVVNWFNWLRAAHMSGLGIWKDKVPKVPVPVTDLSGA